MKQQSWMKYIGLAVGALILLAGIGFGVYVSDYYRAEDEVRELLAAGLESGQILADEEWLALPADDADIGLIFYPGAKVEYISYLPFMQALREEGINGYLVEMPFNLAFFGSGRAADIMAAHPEIKEWYIGGHSLGGAFASSFAAEHADRIDGVILLGSYLYGAYPAEQSLTIFGTNDLVLNRDKITGGGACIEMDGANHAQFGNYGVQDGDGAAEISAEEQQRMTVDHITEWMQE